MPVAPMIISPEWARRNMLYLLNRSDEEILRNLGLPERTRKAERIAAIRKSRKEAAEFAVDMIWPNLKGTD